MSINFGIYCLQKQNYIKQFTQLDVPNSFDQQNFIDQQIYLCGYQRSSLNNNILWHDYASGLVILADAVILNRIELCKQLSIVNVDQLLVADCQLILHAYKHWGVDSLHHLQGNFSFAIWDPQKQLLFLACDAIGNRSLFYGINSDGAFCFANFPKYLFDVCKIKRTLNQEKIGDYLTLTLVDPQDTYFKEVKRLPGGHYLVINENNHRVQPVCYWSASMNCQDPLVFSSKEDLHSQFYDLFNQVISEQLQIANNRVACHLSGGLDSSAVTSVVASQLREKGLKLDAFGYIPTPENGKNHLSNWNYDDQIYMQAVMQQYDNVNLHLTKDDSKTLFEYAEELHPWMEMPPLNPTNMLWIIACVEKARKLGLSYLLVGTVGNSTISWCGQQQRLNKFNMFKAVYHRLNVYKNFYHQWHRGSRRKEPWGDYAAVSPKLIQSINLSKRYYAYNFIRRAEELPQQRHYVFDKGLFGSMATLFSTIRLLYGVDHWDPTADKRIVEFCLRLPNEAFHNGKKSRLLVREGLKNMLPAVIRERASRGMQSADWYKKVEQQKIEISQLLQSWRKTVVADYINVDHLLKLMPRWDYQKVSNSRNDRYRYYNSQYHLKLLRAIETGLFIQWHVNED